MNNIMTTATTGLTSELSYLPLPTDLIGLIVEYLPEEHYILAVVKSMFEFTTDYEWSVDSSRVMDSVMGGLKGTLKRRYRHRITKTIKEEVYRNCRYWQCDYSMRYNITGLKPLTTCGTRNLWK